jgi:hypothetical protein
MGSFRVSFFNELVGSQGQVFKVCQRSVEIRSARSIDRAIAAAKRKFESEENIAYWAHRARSFEVERLKTAGATLSRARHIAKTGEPRHRERFGEPVPGE